MKNAYSLCKIYPLPHWTSIFMNLVFSIFLNLLNLEFSLMSCIIQIHMSTLLLLTHILKNTILDFSGIFYIQIKFIIHINHFHTTLTQMYLIHSFQLLRLIHLFFSMFHHLYKCC